MPDQEVKAPSIPPTINEVALTLDVVTKMFSVGSQMESEDEMDMYFAAAHDLLGAIKTRCMTSGPMQVRMETLVLISQLNSARPH